MPALLGVFAGKAGCSDVTEPVWPETIDRLKGGMSVGGGPGGGLAGFLWGTPKVFGGSRSWSLRDFRTPALGGRFAAKPGVVGGQLIAGQQVASAVRRFARRVAATDARQNYARRRSRS